MNPLPYIDSCEQPHILYVAPPHSIPIGFAQYCRACQPYWGFPDQGFCRYHEVYVSGLHSCPDWELRCCEEENVEPFDQSNQKKASGTPAEDDQPDTLLTQLADMKRRMRSRRRRKRRIAAGD